MDSVFIGREGELEALGRLLRASRAVLVVGEPGVGKTALVSAYTQRVGADVHEVVDQVETMRPEQRLALGRHQSMVALSRVLVRGWTGAVLRLGGLPRPDARLLWDALDEKRGRVRGFSAAFYSSNGVPRLLIDLHDGLPFDQQAHEALTSLEPADRRMALIMAAAGGAIHVDAYDATAASVASLVERLIAEPCGVGFVRIGARWRAPVLASATEEERRAAERAASALTTPQALAGQPEAALRYGAAHLERLLATLPPEQKDAGTRAARVHLLVDALDARRARALADLLPADEDSRLTRARVALLCGRLDSAERAIESLHPARSAWVTAWLTALRREAMDETALARIPEPEQRFHRAWTAWWCGEDDKAHDAAEEALSLVERESSAALLLNLLLAALEGRSGQMLAARERLAFARARIDPGEHPRWHAILRFASTVVDEESGGRLAAVAELGQLHEAFMAAGEMPLALASGLEAARLLNYVGRRAAAMTQLRACDNLAARLGIHIGLRRERVLAQDLVRGLWRSSRLPPPAEHTSRMARWLATRALQAAVSGHERNAQLSLDALPPLDAPDYAVERMVVALARATLSRIAHRAEAHRRQLADAAAQAALGGVDSVIVGAVSSVLSRDLLVTPRSRRLHFGTGNSSSPSETVVVDAARQEVRGEGVTVSLAHRPLLARLLYTMAAEPGRVFDKNALALALWGIEYNPLMHDNTLKANVHRLNRLLAKMGVTVSFHDVGYRLSVPGRFQFIEHRDEDRAVPDDLE